MREGAGKIVCSWEVKKRMLVETEPDVPCRPFCTNQLLFICQK